MSDPIKDIIRHEKDCASLAWRPRLRRTKTKDLPQSCRLVLNYLSYLSYHNRGVAHVKLSTIQSQLNMPRKTLLWARRRLIRDGYISVDIDPSSKSRKGRKFTILKKSKKKY